MDLLETILRPAGFEQYQDVFKQYGINSFNLKLLSDQDLIIMGIQDEGQREHFLKILINLQIPSEKKLSLVVDKSYAVSVLNQVSFHLQKQTANLIYITKREDVDLCDIRLTPAILTLQDVLTTLLNQVDQFEIRVLEVKKRKNRKKYIVISSFLAMAVAGFVTCKFKNFI